MPLPATASNAAVSNDEGLARCRLSLPTTLGSCKQHRTVVTSSYIGLNTEALSLAELMTGRAKVIVHQKEWRLQPPDSVEAIGGPLSGALQIEAA